MASITSVELNYIILRYLKESGFTHTAFAFNHEAGFNKSPIDCNLVPPEALVKLVQKGLQYKEMEANLTNIETNVDKDFSFLQPMDLITKDVHELQKILRDDKKNLQEARGKELRKEEGAHCLIKNKEGKNKPRNDLEKQNSARVGKERVEKGTKRIRKGYEVQNTDFESSCIFCRFLHCCLVALSTYSSEPIHLPWLTAQNLDCQKDMKMAILESHRLLMWSPYMNLPCLCSNFMFAAGTGIVVGILKMATYGIFQLWKCFRDDKTLLEQKGFSFYAWWEASSMRLSGRKSGTNMEILPQSAKHNMHHPSF
ncbi:hypothetical protein BUALT_Bualt04G0105600 [Buddleja alternifolia]|uniref:LisH domain-containing protein n=1 Tax=Buddleja alternifolia TaxID=168488 RepID=A0AAV6XUM5_9LAMI|nr:hypothetical protein BUALT_Bualt04G0105600 [Buddleja alternifolia]